MKMIVVLVASLMSATAFGNCSDAALLDRPDIPLGQEANLEQMLAAQAAVRSYVRSGETYLNCVEPEPFVYDLIVHRLERTAKRYNRERSRYLEQQEAVAAN